MSSDNVMLSSTINSARIRVSIYQGRERSLSASLFAKRNGNMLAYIGDVPANECRVCIDDRGHASLWIGRAALDIHAKEAPQAADTLQIRLVDERAKPEAK